MESKKPLVSVIMGSTSDMPVMEAALTFLEAQQIPFELCALSAHRTPDQVLRFASEAHQRGVKVIIAAAGMAAHLPGVVAAVTALPVIGVPIKASLDGMDALLAIAQMPPGIPVATVAINGAQNAAILALQIIATGDPLRFKQMQDFKISLKQKIVKANDELGSLNYSYRVAVDI